MDSLELENGSKLHNRLEMLRKDSRNKALRTNCIELALAERNYNIALSLTDEALRQDVSDSQARFARASAMIGLKRLDDALLDLNVLAEPSQPVHPAVLQNIALCHYLSGNYSAARSPLDKLYQGGIRSSDLFRLLISTLHHLGEIDAAIKIADTASEQARSDEALAGVMGLLYLDASQPQKAAQWSSRSLARNPNSLDGLVVQGTLRAGAFDLVAARNQFERALSIAPTAGRASIGLALVAMAEHDLHQAKVHAEQAVNYMPGHIGSWHVLAWIQLIQGNLNDARVTFEHALSLNRNFAESHGGLAAIAALQGRRDQSQKLIEVAERLDSNCLSAKFARSTLQKGVGDNQAARETLFTALSGISSNDGSMLTRIVGELSRRH